MNVNKQTLKVHSVSFRDETIRKRLLDVQHDLYYKYSKKHSMEEVLDILLQSYQKNNPK